MANEKRLDLIDRKALLADFERLYCTPCKADGKDYHEVACRACWVDDMRIGVEDAPTVDAVEVVHGRWIHASNKPGVWIGMKCSLCGARIRYSEFINGNHNYCHKCGAKMDSEMEAKEDGNNHCNNSTSTFRQHKKRKERV